MATSTVLKLVRGAGMAVDAWSRRDFEVRTGKVARNAYPARIRDGVENDYSKLFESLLARGNYGYKNPEITSSNFPGKCVGDFEGVLYHPNRDISSEDVLEELDQNGLRPATMLELLIFGAKFPEKLVEFPIAALGQCCLGSSAARCVGCLSRRLVRRRVDLSKWANIWFAYDHFLAVSKSKILVV